MKNSTLKKHILQKSALLSTVFMVAAFSQAQPATAEQDIIAAPAGQYSADPDHTNLMFSVNHMGLSNYILRFTDFDVTVDLVPDNLSASSVKVKIDPASISTDYQGDYKAAHADSPFASWHEDLAQSPNFLNAAAFPTITFQSTKVTPQEEGTLRIEGDLVMLGKTRPITLEAELIGATKAHPMNQMGAMGFSATGTFKRSDFGMTYLLEPPMVGDTVTLHFEGEFLQDAE